MASNALKALLGVLAVAGYQNRDKIRDLLNGLRNPQPGPDGQPQGGGWGDLLGGLAGSGQAGSGGPGGLGGLFGGSATAGGGLAGGLGELLRQFHETGHGETANSWVQPGENKSVDNRQLSEVLGPEVLDELSARTGLPREEILSRLSRELPTAVDDLTPNGRLPTDDDMDPSPDPSAKPQMI
ncbi:YidB family protein (plasmid) [Ensifer adhaerens]|uniref:YidB family protein n=1 Tax=Ensifer adhaerens TaxID=106592 RepID=UPI001CBE071E|nr:YidB family protein [Ensifer adhaerens]MBZ7927597.1 YidB family protein [Ensifer adhaerens]UAX98003.1 YidB family protein [Ensifer adhaerens]UAY05383.1 YidB family protein [Ensifer adhaerens]UAY12761.1 YidB family protein [Ensifer adhaerens]